MGTSKVLRVDRHVRKSFLLRSCLITWPPFKIPYFEECFYQFQFSFYLLSLCLSYSLFDHLHNTFAINPPGNSLENTFSLSSSFYFLISLTSFPYSLLNSFTNSFVFSRFSLLFYVSSSTVYPFYCTKNFSFPLTILLFSILSTSNSFSPFMMTGFGDVLFCSSTWGLYRRT